jgi:hypothetical protein
VSGTSAAYYTKAVLPSGGLDGLPLLHHPC